MALTDDQQSAQDWINNSASGQGGMDQYTKTQQQRYNDAVSSGNMDLINSLQADAQRVGYSLSPQAATSSGNMTASAPPAGPGASAPPPAPGNFTMGSDGAYHGVLTNDQLATLKNGGQLNFGGGNSSPATSLGGNSAPVSGGSNVASQLNATARVTSQDWLNNPDWQSKLREMQGNPDLAMAELNRVKGVYDSAASSGADPTRLQQIRSWANQVRQAAGINANDPFYGNGVTPTADGSLHMSVNGQQSNTPVYQGTAFDSADKLAQSLGVSYSRDPVTHMPIIGGKTFNAVSFDANGNPLVPTKLVAETLGYQVGYDDKSKTVSIMGGPQPAAPNAQPQPQPQPMGNAGGGWFATVAQTMPQQQQITPYQAPDLSGYASQIMPYQQFNPDWNQYYTQARSQLDPQYQMKYNDLMNTLNGQVQKVNESMNRRGLFNSGIAQAAENDLRAKTTDSVARIFMTEQGAIEKNAQALYGDAYKQALQGNQFALKNNQFIMQQMMSDRKQAFTQWLDTQKLSMQQYQYALNAWDKMSGFIMHNAQMAMQDAHFQQNMDFNQFKFNNLSADQQATLQQQYDKMNQDWAKTLLPYQQMTQFQQGQLNQGQQKIDLQSAAQQISAYFKQMGINIDEQKLQEAIRHDQADESLSGARINADMVKSQAQLQEKINYDKAMIDKASATSLTEAKRLQLDTYKSQLSSITQQIGDYVNAGHPEQIPDKLMKAYNDTMDNISGIIPKHPQTVSDMPIGGPEYNPVE